MGEDKGEGENKLKTGRTRKNYWSPPKFESLPKDLDFSKIYYILKWLKIAVYYEILMD